MEVAIKNTLNKKLKKGYNVVIPYKVVEERIDGYIEKVKGNFSLKGFRKGHVPPSIIKEKYGQSIMAEESDKIISENLKKIVKDNDLKLALSPKVDVGKFEFEKDIELNVVLELYPKIPDIELAKLKVVKKEAEIADGDLKEAKDKLLKFHRNWDIQEKSYVAKNGDAINIDYVGKIDDEEFEGGSAKGYQLELGSKSFIDNFEEQMEGCKSGDEKKIKVKFPKKYHNDKYAGKAAEFSVKVNDVLVAKEPEIDDKFVKSKFGLESLQKLEEVLKEQVENNYKSIGRSLFKKELFDFLNKKYNFDLPSGLVELQLDSLWKQTEEELKVNPEKFKNDKEKNKAKEKQREVAERMVRCGMIISKLAQDNKVEATDNDLNQEIGKILSQFPGQEQDFIEKIKGNREYIENLRASVIEEKTIDFIMSNEAISSKSVSVKDLEKIWEKANNE